jgi:RNA-directed DNA polymerase
MKWESYSSQFSIKALKNGYSQDEINILLNYAENLFSKKLPIIFDQRHFALLVGYNETLIRRISNSQHKFYRNFTINKKSGGKRTISEPLPTLKEIQYWILVELLSNCKVSSYTKSYVKDISIKDNARFHINKPIILSLDIKDFFSSLRYLSVYNLFMKMGYSSQVSTLLGNLCCLDGGLPQGAPTSPYLSNLLMRKVDYRIAGFIKKRGIFYTRYADDMTFSGDFSPGMVIRFVQKVLKDEGLFLNQKKIRVRKAHQQQEVTGVVVNEKIQAPRSVRRKLRQEIYYIEKYGLGSHLNKTGNLHANYIYHLLGIANFILFLNPKDKAVLSYKDLLIEYITSR